MSETYDSATLTLLISELGGVLGVPELVLDESGICCLGLDDVVVNLEYKTDTGMLMLYSVVATLPEEGREQMLSSALGANLLWGETKGDTLALAEESGAILLQRQMPAEELDVQSLAASLESFTDACERWTEKLGQAAAQESSAEIMPMHDFA